MGKFDIYKEVVRLDTTGGKDIEYVLKPVGGNIIDKVFSVMTKFSGVDENISNDEFLKHLDADSIRVLRELVLETLKASYPDEDQKALEYFAQQNFFTFMTPCINVNMGKVENVAKDKALKGKA